MSLEGQQLGRYRLIQLIGSGGMGEVYLAQDPGINRQVAIKVFRTELAGYPGTESWKEATRLFQREAKAIAMLDHPGILTLYDYGEQSINGAILIYMVMPYREEGSLANWLQRSDYAPLSLQNVEQMVQQAAAALQYAHDHQVVHQDVKPSNFLVRSSRENPKRPDLLLTDFGIAKLGMLTTRASQNIRGTPTYMAPEMWEGHPVPATDQYELAVMVYELLTGHPPFRGTPMQMMYAHVNTQPQAPSLLKPGLSEAIDVVFLRGLAKRPEERFPSILGFAFAFRQALRSINPSISVGASSFDQSVYIKAPNTLGGTTLKTPRSRDQQATLAISEEEARVGTNRTLTLPGGRQIRIKIPSGARDGQVISVLDQSESTGGGSAGRVHLTLSVMHTARYDAPLLINDRSTERDGSAVLVTGDRVTVNSGTTIPASEGEISARYAPNVLSGRDGNKLPDSPFVTMHAGSTVSNGSAIASRRRKSSRGSVLFLVVLVCLLVAGSAGLFYYYGGHYSKQGPDVSVTVTAQANSATTPIANGTATAKAIAYSNATATEIASKANPYPPYAGSLVLNDPLSDNNHGHQWEVYSDSTTENSCQFGNGAYHVVDMPHFGGSCFATTTNFSNFTYQVEMTFVKAGQSFDGGGIAIRSSGNNYYYFEVFESGRYAFDACIGKDCSHKISEGLSQGLPAFHAGLNQSNTIAIVANGNSFNLYVNGEHVAGPVRDTNSISSHGMIGVFGGAYDATTEVVYHNAKVWA